MHPVIPVLGLIFVAGPSLSSGDSLWCQLCICTNNGSVVDCRQAGLGSLPLPDWSNPTNFTRVIFDNNTISDLKAFPENRLNVSVMSFRNNAITSIENAAFKYVGGLKEIDLSYNHLSSDKFTGDIFKGPYVGGMYQPLVAMEVLRLSGNGLHTLDPNLFEHLPNLRVLTLDSNPFGVIDHGTLIALANIPKLEYLDLARTKLREIPQYMLHTSMNLLVLNISYNNLENIPSEIEYAHKLQHLVLDGNPIEEIHTSPLVPTLRRLDLSSMPKLLRVFSRSLGNFTQLRELVMVNNSNLYKIDEDALVYVEKADPGIKVWPQIKKLNISDNRLAWLDPSFIGDWGKLDEVGIGRNPWVCDCQNNWFLSELMPRIAKLHPDEASRLVCHDPVEMRGRSILELSKNQADMRCLDYYGNQPENDGTIILFTCIATLAVVLIIAGTLAYLRRETWNFAGGRCSYRRAGSLEAIYHH